MINYTHKAVGNGQRHLQGEIINGEYELSQKMQKDESYENTRG
jgi:hypothetical protein